MENKNEKVESKVVKEVKQKQPVASLTGQKIAKAMMRELDATSNLLAETPVKVGSPMYNFYIKNSGKVLKEYATRVFESKEQE